jgi:hypothetical protein
MDGGFKHAEDFGFKDAAESDSVVSQKKKIEDQRPAHADGLIIAEPDRPLGKRPEDPDSYECLEAIGGHRLPGRGAVFRPFSGIEKRDFYQ